jgi:1-aminocyclopropane-1-carboxylate deaminase/D-cysteine desulfhydrase-like pyridoxal-dependent ACC family enzyme
MNPLADRFPGLARLPFVPLVDAPTKVHVLERLSAMTGVSCWVKRDDLTSPRYGGNKVRKLEWLFGEAKAKHADVLVTTGAVGSNHVLATAIHGIKEGFGVHALLSPQPMTRHVEENLRADLAVGATLIPVASPVIAPLAMKRHARDLERKGFRPYVIPHGGSSPVGILGYVTAGLELAAQIERGDLPEPDAIVVALGSGGTASGLAIGLAAAGVPAPIHAVRVTPKVLANPVVLAVEIRSAVKHLRAFEPAFPEVTNLALSRIRIESSLYGEGYGTPHPEAARARELAAADGIVTDPTYTARAFAFLVQMAEQQRAKRPLYVSTLSSADLGPLLRVAPMPARWATSRRSLFRRRRGRAT